MFKKFTNGCVRMVEEYMPDPFLFCIILTGVCMLAAMVLTKQSFFDMTVHWGKGFWGLLSFAMQMCLALTLGHAMASSPPVSRILKMLAMIPKTPAQSVAFVTFISMCVSWLNWGFGLVVGALFAKEVAKLGKRVDYRLLVAAAYFGFQVFGSGLSSPVTLGLANVNATVIAQTGGVVTENIPVTETIFANYNLFILLCMFILMPFLAAKMHPEDKDIVMINPDLLKEDTIFEEKNDTVAAKMENSRIIAWFAAIIGTVFLVWELSAPGFNLSINSANMILLTIGILAHGTPIRYVRAMQRAATGAAGIILQFPFYAGIMGMMAGVSAATGLSLGRVITDGFISISSTATYPVMNLISVAFINLFIPSAGGQWSVQGPIMVPAGVALNVPPQVTAMVYSWGDNWTNLIQPFWALPALGIAGLGAKDIMGFCVTALFFMGALLIGTFLFVGVFML